MVIGSASARRPRPRGVLVLDWAVCSCLDHSSSSRVWYFCVSFMYGVIRINSYQWSMVVVVGGYGLISRVALIGCIFGPLSYRGSGVDM